MLYHSLWFPSMLLVNGFNYFRAGNVEEALHFAQTQMAEAHDSRPEALNELERTLALLAFEKPQNSPFADLLEQSYRQKVSTKYLMM